MFRRLVFDLWYLRRPPWDTGVVPPEIVTWASGSGRRPGRALDVGCGTGTTSRYLASLGWDVVGVDFSRRAIRLARSRAGGPRFVVGDVTRPLDLDGPFDLVVDVGCFHSLPHGVRDRYVGRVSKACAPGARMLLFGFDGDGSPGLRDEEVRRRFEMFTVRRIDPEKEPAMDRGMWFLLEKELGSP